MIVEETIEINDRPAFQFGDKVRALKNVRNDGTYPGMNTGDALISAGDVGYVRDIGTFLQQYFIYVIDFIDRGRMVGMRKHELELVAAAEPEDFI